MPFILVELFAIGALTIMGAALYYLSEEVAAEHV